MTTQYDAHLYLFLQAQLRGVTQTGDTAIYSQVKNFLWIRLGKDTGELETAALDTLLLD
jgi:hypothetical protein